MGVVEKDPIHMLVMDANIKGECRVKRIRTGAIGKCICVPVYITITSSIERPRFFTETDKPFSGLKFFIGGHLLPAPACSEGGIVFVDDVTFMIQKTETNRIFSDDQCDF